MSSNIFKGKSGELYAREYLENKGYAYITSNFKTRFGEIDLIFKDKKRIIFVEVKFRTSLLFGDPIESVTRAKLTKLKKAIYEFLGKNPQFQKLLPSIEVVGIFFENNNPKITHIKDIV